MRVFVSAAVLTIASPAVTLEEALDAALRNHPQSAIAAYRAQSAESEARIAASALYPKVELNADYFPTKTFVMPTGGVFSTRQSDAFHADVSVTCTVWDFGRTRSRHDAAKEGERSMQHEAELSRVELAEQVWLAYYSAAYLSHRIESTERSARFYDAQYRRAAGMRQAGLKTEADELRFKSLMMEATDENRAARDDYDKTLTALQMLMGTAQKPSAVGDDFVTRSERSRIEYPDASALRQALGEKNLRLKALRAQIEQARSLLDASLKASYGTVSLVGSYGYDHSLSSYNSSLIGVRGTLPLYEAGRWDEEAQKSRIALSLAQKGYENTERTLWQELYGAYLDWSRSDGTIRTKTDVIEATSQTLRLMEGRYAQGLATYVDLLEAQSALENARLSLAGARLQKIRSWVEIGRLLGTSGEEPTSGDGIIPTHITKGNV